MINFLVLKTNVSKHGPSLTPVHTTSFKVLYGPKLLTASASRLQLDEKERNTFTQGTVSYVQYWQAAIQNKSTWINIIGSNKPCTMQLIGRTI